MALEQLLRELGENSNLGARSLRDVPLVNRGRLTQMAGPAFDEALAQAYGKPVNGREMKRLGMVAKIVTGRWEE